MRSELAMEIHNGSRPTAKLVKEGSVIRYFKPNGAVHMVRVPEKAIVSIATFPTIDPVTGKSIEAGVFTQDPPVTVARPDGLDGPPVTDSYFLGSPSYINLETGETYPRELGFLLQIMIHGHGYEISEGARNMSRFVDLLAQAHLGAAQIAGQSLET